MIDSKEKLLQYFAGLDVATLQKLQKYSQLLIIPDEDLLTNVTMIQMVDKAHNLADALFPEWSDRSKSDFGEFLIEIFSVFSEKDFWYINAFANEGLLSKTRLYSNAFSKASSMGYQVVTCKGATCTFNVTFSAGDASRYDRGDLVIEVGGIKFTNDDSFSVEKISSETTKQIVLHEGVQVAEDSTYNGYSLFIRKPNIDVDSVKITIDNIVYTQVSNFGLSSQDSAHFMVLPEEDGSCSVFFGSNGYGVQPPIGKNIRVEYRKCSGTNGNIPISESFILDSLPSRLATKATMINASFGGTYAEELTSIKEKAPLYFNTKRAAINEQVSQDIINSFKFVYKSKVYVVGQEVLYRIIPVSGFIEPTAFELKTIEEEFHPYLMAGYTGKYETNTYKNLLTSASVLASKIIIEALIYVGYNPQSIESSIRQIMDDVTNPLVKANYGGSFVKSDVDLLIRASIPGVVGTSFKILVGSTEQIMPDVTLEPVDIFRAIDQKNLIIRTNAV